VDGDLSDWPKGLTKYRITEDNGSKPKSATDFTAHYRVAYDPDNGRCTWAWKSPTTTTW
jgi:hypothetical protein